MAFYLSISGGDLQIDSCQSYILILPHSHTFEVNGDDCDDRFCNFPYRKSFTPDLNVFPYTKVIISIATIVTAITSNSRYLLSRTGISNVPFMA